jgi:RimJ/RimL family protein N-acetyltransferase
MKENISFIRNEFEENQTIIKTYIFPSLCEKDDDELVWSNLAYQVKYQGAKERDNTRELVAVTDEDILGYCVLKYINFENQNMMISTRWLADEAGQWPNSDEMAQSLDSLINLLFNRFDIRKVYGIVDEDCSYLESIRQVGFYQEGCLKENFYKNGRYIDQYIYARKYEKV